MKKGKSYSNGKKCQYCGSRVSLRTESEIYGNGDNYMWVCNNYPACNAYVHCAPGTTQPLGTLADKDLRRLRIRAHRALNRISDNGYMSRADIYAWIRDCDYDDLTGELMPGHIAQMTDRQCLQLIADATALYNHLRQVHKRSGGAAA